MFELGELQVSEEVIEILGKGDAVKALGELKNHLIMHASLDWSKYDGVSKFSFTTVATNKWAKDSPKKTLWICTEFDHSTTKVWLKDADKPKGKKDESKNNGNKPD